MEVEVKLRLPDAAAHEKLTAVLAPHHVQTQTQENLFFDTPHRHLASASSALRLRFYDLDSRCVLSLKSRPVLSAGISRVEELEQPVDPYLARAWAAQPRPLAVLSGPASEIARRVERETEGAGLVGLGGFRNVRRVYEWEGMRVEVDETGYGFGVGYEVECESLEPERDKMVISGLLRDNGIEFCYSGCNKFEVFMSGKLPPYPS